MTSKYIDRLRNDIVRGEAKQLFDQLVMIVANMTPANCYAVELPKQPVKELDNAIITRTQELFLEIGITLNRSIGLDNVVFTLSEAREIPTKILHPLFWSRAPGKFVNKLTGKEVKLTDEKITGPIFTGTVREWYETLIETLIDGANSFMKEIGEFPTSVSVSDDLLCIIECSVLYKPSFTVNGDIPPSFAGTLPKFKVFKDDTLLSNVAKLSGVKDGVKYTLDVNVLDMNII